MIEDKDIESKSSTNRTLGIKDFNEDQKESLLKLIFSKIN